MLFLGTFFSSYSGIFCCLLGIRVAYVCIECVLMIHTKISIGCVLIAHYIDQCVNKRIAECFLLALPRIAIYLSPTLFRIGERKV